MRRIASISILALLILTLFVLAFNTRLAKTEATTIVVPDDYPTIQEAINAASDGDTVFVRNGAYYENIVVNKTISLIGENMNTTIIDGGGAGVDIVEIAADNVSFSSFTVQNSLMRGVVLHYSRGCTVSDNMMLYCEWGLVLINSDYTNVMDNDVLNSTFMGIGLDYSSYNILRDNVVAFNYMWGMYVDNSEFNVVMGNTIEGTLSPYFSGSGLELEYNTQSNIFYHNNFIDNSPGNAKDNGQNAWDNGCEGNYWSDYTGNDMDGDGIGDTQYGGEGTGLLFQDDYPLMNPYWNPADVDHDLDVDIYDVVLAAGAYGSTPSDPNWNPHCDIAEPYGVVNIYDIVVICNNYREEYNP